MRGRLRAIDARTSGTPRRSTVTWRGLALFAATVAIAGASHERALGEDRTMLVLDRSASMARSASGSSTLLEEQRDAVAAVIAALPSEHRAGMASFATGARLDAGLRALRTAADRAALQAAAAALVAGGGSCLGDGLDVALAAIRAAGAASGIESIVVLTDGGDTGSIRDALSAVLPEFVARGIRVFAFALESGADEALLAALARASGGGSARASDSGERGRDLLQSLPRIAASARVGGFDDLLASGEESRFSVPLEGGGAEAVLAAALPSRSDAFELEVITPSRVVLRSTSQVPGVEFADLGSLQLVRISSPEMGTWSLRVRAGASWIGTRHVRAEVLLSGRERAAVDASVTPLSVDPPASARIAAQLSGFSAPLPPTLEAQWIDASGAILERFELRDEGSALDGDEVAHDGTFGALFAGFESAGAFRLRVFARGERAGAAMSRCDDVRIDVTAPRPPQASFLRPLVLDVLAIPGVDPRNRLRFAVAFDLPPRAADPSSDELVLEVGALELSVAGGSLVRSGARWIFRDATTELALATGARGSSSARLDLELAGFDGAAFGALDRVPIALAFGSLELDGVLLSRVDSGASHARWREGDALEDVPWQVLDCSVDRRTGSLASVQRIGRDLFDPTSDELHLAIEGWAISVPAGALRGGPRRYRFEALGVDREVRLDVDLRSGLLVLRGRGLRFFGSPDALEIGLGIGLDRADLVLRPAFARERLRY